jgi:hypothetical protein
MCGGCGCGGGWGKVCWVTDTELSVSREGEKKKKKKPKCLDSIYKVSMVVVVFVGRRGIWVQIGTFLGTGTGLQHTRTTTMTYLH